MAALTALAPSGAAAAGPHPSLAATGGDELVPGFEWGVRTYGARCGDDGLALAVDGAAGWKVAIGTAAARGGDFGTAADIASGEGVEVEFRHRGEQRTAFVRCMPADMVLPVFKRIRKGGPSLYAVQTPPAYGVVMSRAGAPSGGCRRADSRSTPRSTRTGRWPGTRADRRATSTSGRSSSGR